MVKEATDANAASDRMLRLEVGERGIDKARHRIGAAQARGYRPDSCARPLHRANSGTSCFAPLLQALNIRRPSGIGS